MKTELFLLVEAVGTANPRELTKAIAEAVKGLGGIRSVELLASRLHAAPPGDARSPMIERRPG